MAGEEAAEGSRTRWRRSMDLNLHPPELSPWWQHPFLHNTAATSSPTMMPNSSGAAPEASRTGEPEESLTSPAYFPSNVLSAPEQHPMPSAGGGMQMISTSMLHPSTQGAAATEPGAPELRLMRAIQISEQHNIVSVRPRSSSHNQGSSSTDAHSLAQAIQHTHINNSSEQAARQQNPDAGDNNGVGGSFECNICLEPARDPVVTSCGHLFCWPCLYQWLTAESLFFSECPVCKGEVLRADITPIYGRGGGEEGDSTAYPNLPPRPQANRRESLRHRMQMAESTREMAALVRQMIRNQGIGTRGAAVLPAPAAAGNQMTARPQRAAARRVQRQDGRIAHHIEGLNMRNAASEHNNQLQLPPHPNGDNAAHQVVLALAAPRQQPSSVEQLDEPGPSRRSRPSGSGSPTIRRTRRRPQ